jgi:Glyoxalase-like domain
MIELDHVILATPDLDGSAQRLESEHRLPSAPGGRHAGLGTENRIVPLGDAYVELLGVADRDEAAANPFGSWLLAQVADGEAWIGWSVRTDDLEGVCARLGLEAQAMSRSRPDGFELRWRVAGLARARDDPSLPFFISWDVPGEDLPGRAGGEVQATGARIAAVEIGADEEALREWLGELPGTVRAAAGPPGVHSVAVAGAGGIEVLEALKSS